MKSSSRSGLLLLILVLLPLLISLHLMSGAIQNSDELSRLFIPLLIFNIVGLFVLLVMIVVNLFRLIGEYRRREAGSLLKTRMVLVFLMLSLPPVSVVYYYSLQFLHQGIDSWFDVNIDQALDDSLQLSRASLELNKKQYLRATQLLFEQVDDFSEAAMALELADLLTRSDAVELVLLENTGRVISSTNIDPGKIVPDTLETSVLQQAVDGGDVVSVVPFGENKQLHVMVVTMHPFRSIVLQAIYPMSEQISDLTASLEKALVRYKELAFLRQSLKFNFSLTLVLVLVFSIFAAVWAAFYSARKLVAPISDIAAGTRAVAAGNYDTQLPMQDSHDELSFLVSSFNTMLRRLSQASDQASRSQRMVEEQKTYLETVLGHLSSGVMVFDSQKVLQTANRAASVIFGAEFDDCLHQKCEKLKPESDLVAQWVDSIESALEDQESEWREEISLYGNEGRLVLLTRVSPLFDTQGKVRGRVVVFDDITQLLQAQRNAAWGEVARRLAHEIKNPLTPIQLSAERLRHKCLANMQEDDARVLDKATHTIVQQVDAMKSMVNAFSDYAKPSRLETKPLDADGLVKEVMALYETSGDTDKMELDLRAGDLKIEADAVRIRQVIHNLVKNAKEAVEGLQQASIIVRTQRLTRPDGESFVLEVLDNGPGFDEDGLDKVFEPYVTNKSKGTGLGLAVVKKIIEEHGGMILASNREQGGARLLVRLPVFNPEAANKKPTLQEKRQ